MFVWSLLTAASGLARNFWQLFAVRLGVGVGEASCAPAAISLIGDLYRTEQRARATAIFMMGLPIGLGLSFLVGGVRWRSAGAGVRRSSSPRRRACCARSPRSSCASRRAAWSRPTPSAPRRRPGSPYRLVLSIPTLWWIIVSGALHNFNMYALGAFLGSFLIRYHRVSLSRAGLIAMVVYGLSGIFGLIGGGIAADAHLHASAGTAG